MTQKQLSKRERKTRRQRVNCQREVRELDYGESIVK